MLPNARLLNIYACGSQDFKSLLLLTVASESTSVVT